MKNIFNFNEKKTQNTKQEKPKEKLKENLQLFGQIVAHKWKQKIYNYKQKGNLINSLVDLKENR